MDGPCSVPSTGADAVDVGPSGSGEWHVVAKSDQLARENARVQITADGRYLVVARSGGRLYAFDATCYHMGAPLLHGDIEDVAGHGACITCPWHHYQISMSSGERLYQDMSRKTCTLPKKQRVHEVMEADGEVRVRLSGGGKPPSPPPGAPQTQATRDQPRVGERQVRVQAAAPVAGAAEGAQVGQGVQPSHPSRRRTVPGRGRGSGCRRGRATPRARGRGRGTRGGTHGGGLHARGRREGAVGDARRVSATAVAKAKSAGFRARQRTREGR